MSRRKLADREGHRWDVEDEGPVDDRPAAYGLPSHQLRFRRDDGAEKVRTAPYRLDEMADIELRAMLEDRDAGSAEQGPDTAANESRGYGEVA